ncbi:MAG: hypothetical protein VXZ38_02595, partial [Planctomycetota bacterium]|nr:hypothetical protein [Planctomycetota bacterium]
CSAVAFVLLVCSGCDQLRTSYGESRGSVGRLSINGFGALRSAYENAGYRTRDITRLSDRVKSSEVIVWTPKVLHPIPGDVTEWMESWLGLGGKTLVFVLPDSGSEVDYWADATELAPIEQRTEYRRREVRGINQQLQWRLNRWNWDANGWFQVKPLAQRQPLVIDNSEQIAKSTAKEINPQEQSTLSKPDGEATRSSIHRRTGPWVEYQIQEYGPANTANTPPTPFQTLNVGETGPGSLSGAGFSSFANWEQEKTRTKVKFESLQSDQVGVSSLVKVTSKMWKDSRVLVVAGGSLLTNYALSKEWNCKLANEVIFSTSSRSSKDATAGFLTSDWNPIGISDGGSTQPVKTGMEMLTKWPLSLITMHGIFLGGIVCLILIPILGRPKQLRRETPTDFTHHLDAVASLMKRAKGEAYARRRVQDYQALGKTDTSQSSNQQASSGKALQVAEVDSVDEVQTSDFESEKL